MNEKDKSLGDGEKWKDLLRVDGGIFRTVYGILQPILRYYFGFCLIFVKELIYPSKVQYSGACGCTVVLFADF